MMKPSNPKGLCSTCNRAVEVDAEICVYCGATLDNALPDKAKSQGPTRGPSESASVPEHSIRERAYYIYRQRGARDGHADGDWFTAEAELKALKKEAAALLSKVGAATKQR